MEQFKRAKVIMLPTEFNNNALLDLYLDNTLALANKTMSDKWSKDKGSWQPQHLYFISDDEIKENDYVYDWYNNKVYKATAVVIHNKKSLGYEYLSKIIATTDTSLKIDTTLDTFAFSNDKRNTLPQPPKEFIEKYVACYNNGKTITDVLVEYEIHKNSFVPLWIPKVNPKDNTITIKFIKNSWNRKEVIKLLEEVRWQTIGNPTEFTKNFKNWIEQNL